MAFVVSGALPPAVVHFITVGAVVRAGVRHIANPSAFMFCYSKSVLPPMFDTDPLCLSRRNQWYPIDATIDESLVEVWLLLPQGAGVFVCYSQSQAER